MLLFKQILTFHKDIYRHRRHNLSIVETSQNSRLLTAYEADLKEFKASNKHTPKLTSVFVHVP